MKKAYHKLRRSISVQVAKSNPFKRSLLLTRLPPEIRLQIWTHIFANTTIYVRNKYGWPHLPSPRLWSILLTCRLIHTETLPLFYSVPTFHFPELSSLTKFRESTPPELFSRIQRLTLFCDMQPDFDGWEDPGWTWYSEDAEQWPEICRTLTGLSQSLNNLKFLQLEIHDESSTLDRKRLELLKDITVGEGNGKGKEGEGVLEIKLRTLSLGSHKDEVREMSEEEGVSWRFVNVVAKRWDR